MHDCGRVPERRGVRGGRSQQRRRTRQLPLRCSCPADYYGPRCATRHECLAEPCQNGGACSDAGTDASIVAGSYYCSCDGASGWDGVNCEGNVDECGSGPCQNGGACADGVNGYSCECASGSFCGGNCEDTDCDESMNIVEVKLSRSANHVSSRHGLCFDLSKLIDVCFQTLLYYADTFSTLATAVNAAGLAPMLSGAGPYTLFAPTNAAFAAVGGVRDWTYWADQLSYHVAAGHVLSSQLSNGMQIVTVEGACITFTIDQQHGVMLNGVATVTTADVECSNGVLHVIDAVLGLDASGHS